MFGRFVDWTVLIVSLAGLAATGWWTVYGAPDNAANLEATLRADAGAALKNGGHEWVVYEVDGQNLRLSGQSPSYDSAEDALANFEISRLFGPYTSVTVDIASAPPITPYVWSATRLLDGKVALDGYVPSTIVLNEIVAEAETFAPGQVVSNLKIGSGEPLGDWKEASLTALNQLSLMDEGEVRLVDSRLLVKGIATVPGAREGILEEMSGLEAPYTGVLDVLGETVWSARHLNGELVLSGQMASETGRAELEALAEDNFDGPVRNEVQLSGNDYGDWLATARSVLPHFAKFRSGIFGFAPNDAGFILRGEATDSTIGYLNQDLVESEFALTRDITAIAPQLSEIAGIDFETDPAVGCQSGFDAVMAGNAITFESGDAVITRDSGRTLDKVLAVISRCEGLAIEVQGHTDSQGSRDSNLALSLARAEAVSAYFTARRPGLDLQAAGLGPDLPIADNADATGRAANRRIEFRIEEEG